ncbi:flagellar biosynthesis protein FlhF [Halobacillus halophilus]|uniref:Flagellar biosynthesis protein FlhF n=1 Tax=Halobacillus halophilus (strain ATCC 35676 / DSM 2266 / JCM 20832 / KCTC 3685 / LMG 17431 / NBRC 102448 / NCIMB 2269) TaxID=866895 RepID=I0JMN0_HALH3|nr:flagellar biosynthesis protein FlhF [Halobacillus halophilus]ASF39481.1 flagellar biosynthesis protein FlhF [Halobacillus halophilus]CCG45400.1 flagellar biosynthesis regulator [Halobacillus halophilus DSM 2266]
MKVKKFQAVTMPEVMKKVKSELGPEAVVLNTKTVKARGLFKRFKKDLIEVIAAVDSFDSIQKKEQSSKSSKALNSNETAASSNEAIMNELKQLRLTIESTNDHSPGSGKFAAWYEHLIAQELEPELAASIVESIERKQGTDHSGQKDGRERLLTEEITKRLNPHPFGHKHLGKTFVHLVGPTGVGKTTTAAKLAAEAVLNQKLNVAFITTDTYRIAAIDQLKTYAKILDVPLEVAYNLKDYEKAIEKYKDFDLVLVDTAGRNYLQSSYVEELNQLLKFNDASETFLVLSLTSKYMDMKNIYEKFLHIPISKVIFTKEDETSTYGSAINFLVHHKIGVAYLTNGQNVPDDIEEASPDKMARKVTEGYGYA